MNVVHYIAPVLCTLAACVGVVSCDNASPPDVPSESTSEPETTPALEVPAKASEEQEPEVVVWVNGDPLPRAVVDRHVSQIQSVYGAQRRPLQGQELALKRRMVTERLIDRQLLDQWLKERERPVVTSEELDETLARHIQERFGDRGVLERHLSRRGATLADYRRDLKRRLELERLLSPGDSAEIADAGVAQTFEAIAARPAHSLRVRAASVFVPWPDDESRETVVDRVVSEATTADDLDAFRRAADRIGKAWKTDFDADVGWLEFGETAGDVAAEVFRTSEGRATGAITTPLGVQVFFVRERQQLESPQFEAHRETLQQHLEERAFMRRKSELVEKLRSDAVLRWNESSVGQEGSQ